MTSVVVCARVLVHQGVVGIAADDRPALDKRLRATGSVVTASGEFLRAYRMLRTIAREGFLSPADADRIAMLVCESGTELRPLWPWDVPRLGQLDCHPADAWCIAIAESIDAPFLTLNSDLADLPTHCPVEVY